MRNTLRAVLQQCDSRCRAYLLFMNDKGGQVDIKIAIFRDFLHIFCVQHHIKLIYGLFSQVRTYRC